MPFDGVDDPGRKPSRRPARSEGIVLMLFGILAIGLLLLSVSMRGFVDLIAYLKTL